MLLVYKESLLRLVATPPAFDGFGKPQAVGEHNLILLRVCERQKGLGLEMRASILHLEEIIGEQKEQLMNGECLGSRGLVKDASRSIGGGSDVCRDCTDK